MYTVSVNTLAATDIKFGDLWCTFLDKVEVSLKNKVRICARQEALFVVVPVRQRLF